MCNIGVAKQNYFNVGNNDIFYQLSLPFKGKRAISTAKSNFITFYNLLKMSKLIVKILNETTFSNSVNQLKEIQLDKTIFLEKFNKNILEKDIEYWGLYINEKVVGFVSIHKNNLLHHDQSVFEIQELIIDKDDQGKGYGTKLMQFIIKRFDKQELELTSNIRRVASKAFFEKLNFSATHYKFTKYFVFCLTFISIAALKAQSGSISGKLLDINSGYELPQTLLIHANNLNADYLDELLEMIKKETAFLSPWTKL